MLTQPALETAIEVSYETRNFHATCIYGDYTVPTSLPIETASQRLGSIVESIEKIDVAEGSPAKTLSRDTYGNFIIVGWYFMEDWYGDERLEQTMCRIRHLGED